MLDSTPPSRAAKFKLRHYPPLLLWHCIGGRGGIRPRLTRFDGLSEVSVTFRQRPELVLAGQRLAALTSFLSHRTSIRAKNGGNAQNGGSLGYRPGFPFFLTLDVAETSEPFLALRGKTSQKSENPRPLSRLIRTLDYRPLAPSG